MTIEFCSFSTRHESKPRNGDAGTCCELPSERGLVLAVSDGVSTRPRDWEASDHACSAVCEVFRSRSDLDVPAAIRMAVETAHSAVQDLGGSDGQPLATLVVAHCDPATYECTLASIGDSRAYLAGARKLRCLTTDDSKSVTVRRDGELVLQGGSIASRSGLTQALGQDGALDITIQTCSIEAGEMLALVTDGMHELGGFEQHLLRVQDWLDIVCGAERELAGHHQAHGRDDGTYALVRRSGIIGDMNDAGLPNHARLSGLLAEMERWAALPDPARITLALEQIIAERLTADRAAAFRIINAYRDDGDSASVTVHRKLVEWARTLPQAGLTRSGSRETP